MLFVTKMLPGSNLEQSHYMITHSNIPELAVCTEVIFATMKGYRKPRQSAHLISAAICAFYEAEKLYPPGLRSDMKCVQQWSLRTGDAVKKMVLGFAIPRSSA